MHNIQSFVLINFKTTKQESVRLSKLTVSYFSSDDNSKNVLFRYFCVQIEPIQTHRMLGHSTTSNVHNFASSRYYNFSFDNENEIQTQWKV